MNEGLTGLERHQGDIFRVNYPFKDCREQLSLFLMFFMFCGGPFTLIRN